MQVRATISLKYGMKLLKNNNLEVEGDGVGWTCRIKYGYCEESMKNFICRTRREDVIWESRLRMKE